MTDRLADLPATLDAFACGDLSISDLARVWRDAAEAHTPALPPRYLDVLERLLNQLESAALFTEESCSFSRSSLLDHLQAWVDKARSVLPGA
ncbi:MAG TPA: hypothetical protein VEQ09_05270 [Aquabacterium sp.]|nr:hypothetical protein [Aquabacterium sp.]